MCRYILVYKFKWEKKRKIECVYIDIGGNIYVERKKDKRKINKTKTTKETGLELFVAVGGCLWSCF